MKKRLLLSAGLLVLALIVPVSVQAHTDNDTEDSTPSITERREAAKERAEDARKNKDTRIAEIKAKIEARKAELKADACQRNHAKIQRRLTNINKNTSVIKAVFDKKYERLVAFYESGHLTTPDYDTLVEAIELAKANAESSIEALASYEFELDCESEDAAEQLDAYREAVKAVKEDLKTYKKSLVDLVSSLKSAHAQHEAEDNAADNESTEGETNNED